MFAFSVLIKTQDKSKWSRPGVRLIDKSQLTGLVASLLVFMQWVSSLDIFFPFFVA